MILPDNNNDILLIYADWLEDQGICTKEFREEIECPTTNSWYFEYRGDVGNDVGVGVNGFVGGVNGFVGGVNGFVGGVFVGGGGGGGGGGVNGFGKSWLL